MRTLLLPLALLALACEIDSGKVGPKPTDKVKAAAANQPTVAPYTDPYADGKELQSRLETAKAACAEGQKQAAALNTKPMRLEKEQAAELSAVTQKLTELCGAIPGDLAASLAAYSDLTLRALNLAHDFRGKSFTAVDRLTGKEDPSKVKSDQAYEAAANALEASGRATNGILFAYLMYAPLEQRKQAATSIFALLDKLPPDFADDFKRKRLGDAMVAEGEEAFRKILRAEVYGTLPE